MKNRKLKSTLFVALIMLLFAACESDINEVVISSDPTEPALAELSFDGEFNMENAAEVITFSWAAADFGFESSTTYGLQLAPTNDFASDVVTLFTTQNLQGTAKVSDINGALLSWNKELGTAATVYYRVYASVTSNEIVYSTVRSREFIPFETLIDYPMLYVPGAYQGWSPGAENGRLFSYGFNSQYQGIIRFVDGGNATVAFKVTENPNWDGPNYGGTLTQSGNNYSGALDASGGDFVANAGTYKVDVDLSALTINLTKTDDWGIIGSAVPPYDWSADVDLFYNGQRKAWEITADFNAGEFKFRANDGWDLNYGDTGADGSLEAGGDNMVLAEAGNYTIRFDPVALTYTVQKN